MRAVPGIRILTVAVLLVAALYLGWFGVWRATGASEDLAVGFGAGRAWLQGQDPYDVAVLTDQVSSGGGTTTSIDRLETLRNVYFPTTLPTFAPLAPASWTQAKFVVLALNLAATAFIAWGLVRLLGWRGSETRTIILWAFILALAPLHTTMAIGQAAIVATAAIVAAMLLERQGRGATAGLFYGIAIVVKLQIGLPFLAYLVWRRRWPAALVAAATTGVLTVVSIVRMTVAGVPWWSSWMANLERLSGPGGINDPSPANADRYALIDLRYLLESIGIGGPWADAVTFGLVGLAALATVILIRGRYPGRELLALSLVAVLCLLVTYHRYYDAVLIALPIAWAIAVLPRQRALALAVLVLCADFLVPTQTALHDLQQRGLVPEWLSTGPLWNTVLITQHVWALVLLAAVLLWAARTVPDDGTSWWPAQGTTLV